MSVENLRASNSSDTMKADQKALKLRKEGHDSLDSIISQEIGRELSFPRTGESSIQWIQFLHALDQQGSSKSNGSKIDNGIEGKEHGLDLFNGLNSFPSEINTVKESVQSLRGNGVATKGTRNTSQQMQTLNFPEAVVAFVQAASKANGEPEKYLPGWPLLSPSKMQLQKCEKCSREFCSTINYRRHIRVHRRSLNIDKDSPKNRGLLGAFWDKISMDDAKGILSLEDVSIEEVSGSVVIKTLNSWIRKSGLFPLPEIYAKAGMALLDLIQARTSSLPISSQELFSILDDASEKTFLCAGTALSLQKFVFDGETGKVALEMKNLIACASFMLEQKLIKAWITDKDAEALRYQKMLVEEEEAAQKRQADVLERKRLKKLRQKEQKEKESVDNNRDDFKVRTPEIVESTSDSTEIQISRPSSVSLLNTSEASVYKDQLFLKSGQMLDGDVIGSSREHIHSEGADQNLDHRLQMDNSQQTETNLRMQVEFDDGDQDLDHQSQVGNGQQQPISARWPPPYSARNAQNGFRSGQAPAYKGSLLLKHGNYRDPKVVTVTSGKIWTRKTKTENEECANDRDGSNGDDTEQEHKDQPDQCHKCEVLIGSINVRLGDSNGHQQDIVSLRKNKFQQKLAKSDANLNGVNRTSLKLWRPVSRHRNGDATVSTNSRETKTDKFCAEYDHNLPDGASLSSVVLSDDCPERCSEYSADLKSANIPGPCLFSSQMAEAFLAQRWKEAIAGDHVMLGFSPETETSDCHVSPDSNCIEATRETLDFCGHNSLENEESRITENGSVGLCTTNATSRTKPEKSHRMRYVPKQRNNGVRGI